jgi:hypothetical protein
MLVFYALFDIFAKMLFPSLKVHYFLSFFKDDNLYNLLEYLFFSLFIVDFLTLTIQSPVLTDIFAIAVAL